MIPLRVSMDVLNDAIRRAESDLDGHTNMGGIEVYQKYEHRGVTIVEEICVVENPGIGDECSVPLCVSLMRIKSGDAAVRNWGLATTYKPFKASDVFDTYRMRTSIEERHKQFKCIWNIAKFSSPDRSLMETHVLFTLLTYSLSRHSRRGQRPEVRDQQNKGNGKLSTLKALIIQPKRLY